MDENFDEEIGGDGPDSLRDNVFKTRDEESCKPDSDNYLLNKVIKQVNHASISSNHDDSLKIQTIQDQQMLQDAILISPNKMLKDDRKISVNFVSSGPALPIMQLEDEFMLDDEFACDTTIGVATLNSMEVDEDDLKDPLDDLGSKGSSTENNSALSSLRSSPVLSKDEEVPPTDDLGTTTDDRRRRGRPRVAKVKEKRKSWVEDPAKSVRARRKAKDEATLVPQSTELLDPSAMQAAVSQLPAGVSQLPAGVSQLPAGVSQLPAELSNSARLKSRRTSKLSDSEDSVVSTDTPLKPGSYIRRYGGVAHGDKGRAPEGKGGTHGDKERSKDTGSTQHKATHRLDKLTESGSPREEQPLIPKSYLIQKKKLESEKVMQENVKQEAPPLEEVKLSPAELLQQEAEDRKEIEKRVKSFRHITENHYLCPRKINKQFRKMQCDCDVVRDDDGEIEQGCLDDCANRMLMIECGKDCLLESYCANKRIQNKENAPIEVFKTHWKGFGIRAMEDIPKDTFLMEYVGEALDHRQFRRRAKHYARTNIEHFYFMALSKDCYVDATNKGNISRFINHSCDPNSMTQKWMVNGENRVGFFTTRDVKRGDELNFDYKYERYGQAAQKCFCGTAICRGWLGREPTSDSGIDEMEEWTTSEEEDEGEADKQEVGGKEEKVRQERKVKKSLRRQREEDRRRWAEEEEWEEEVERLSRSGINNRIQTVLLCRLMVRASQVESRQRLAQLLLDADRPCLRLFLDYQGLRILSQWMQDLEWSLVDLDFKLKCEKLLSVLPIPHRTMLKDSKVWSTTQVWALATPAKPNPTIQTKQPRSPEHKMPQPLDIKPESEIKTVHPSNLPLDSSQAADEPEPMDISQTPAKELDTSGIYNFEEDLYPPGEEPGCDSPLPTSFSTDDDIQVLEEFDPEHSSRPDSRQDSRPGSRLDSRPPSRNEADKMRLKVVEVEEVVAEEGRGREVSKALFGQGVVGDEGDLDILVLPNQREEIPLSEEEELERILLISKVKQVQMKAQGLLEVWSLLQEVFKIPKKERHKIRVEHERELDRHFRHTQSRNSQVGTPASRSYEPKVFEAGRGTGFTPDRNSHYASDRGSSNYHTPERGSAYTPERQEGRSALRVGQEGGGSSRGARSGISRYQSNVYDKSWQVSIVVPRERRNLRLDDAAGRLHIPGLSRDERRTLFEDKIKEEGRQKKLRAAIDARHSQCCRLLGLNPKNTPMFDNYPEFYLVGGERWVPMPAPPDWVDPGWTAPTMAWLPMEAYSATDPKLPNPRDIYPAGVCPQEPPPKPRIIRVPGPAATELEVTAYHEEIYRREPKSPPTSPRPTEPKPAKKVAPPYPGYVVYNAPEVIFFDPESLKPKMGTPVHESSQPPTPSQEASNPRTASQERGSTHKDAFRDSPRPSTASAEPSASSRRHRTKVEHSDRRNGKLAARRSLDSDLGSGSRLLEQIKDEMEERAEKKLDLSPDYKSPSPVRKRCDSPVSSLQDGSPAPRGRLPPRTIDLLNSDPEHEIALQTLKARLEPVELESCDTPIASLLDHGTPLASLLDQTTPQASQSLNAAFSWGVAGPRHSERVNGSTQLNLQAGSTQLSAANTSTQLVVRLPRHWKVARDSEGRLYYYHVESRLAQWEPPTPEQLAQEEDTEHHRNIEDYIPEEGEMETNSSEDEDEEEEDDEEDEEEKEGEESVEPIEEGELTQDQDLSSSEKKMLLRIRNRTFSSREERSVRRKAKRRLERERREQEREINEARSKRHREAGLVTEQLVPRDRNNAAAKEIRERLLHKEEVLTRIDKEIRDDEMAERLEQEKLRREQKKAERIKREAESSAEKSTRRSNGEISTREILTPEPKLATPRHSTPAAPTITAADTSTTSEAEKKAKDRFAKQMSAVIVKTLDPFRNPKSKGHIKTNEDFKHLAKKLTYVIYSKERRQVRSAEDLKITDKMKEKAGDYVRKKMNNYGKEYKRSPTKE